LVDIDQSAFCRNFRDVIVADPDVRGISSASARPRERASGGAMHAKSKSGAVASKRASFDKQASAIQSVLGEAAAGEVDTRYEAAVMIRAVTEQKAYGEKTMNRLAVRLRRSRAFVYRYAAVAKAWSKPEMRNLSRMTNRHGERLLWTHWQVLAGQVIAGNSRWKHFRDRALEEGWPVPRLKEEIKLDRANASISRDDEPEEMDLEASTCEALRETTKVAAQWNAHITSTFGPAIDRLARMEKRGPGLEQVFADALEAVIEAHRKIGEVVARGKAVPRVNPVYAPPRKTVVRAERGLLLAGGSAVVG
jgi:hypothetical protein